MRTILQAFLEGDGFPNELVIDAHTHIGRGFDGSRYIEEAAQRALTRMDAVGIDVSCVMGSQYLIEGDYKEGNNDLLWLHEHYPDRFVCFTNINPLETDGEDMQNRDHECYFSAAHAAKDSGIALELAEAAGLNLPLAEATKEQYDKMIEIGKGELDKSGIAELTFRDRG